MSKYSLIGIDGNAFSVMSYVIKAMRKEGATAEDIVAYQKDATSSNYNHLLMVSDYMINKLNEEV